MFVLLIIFEIRFLLWVIVVIYYFIIFLLILYLWKSDCIINIRLLNVLFKIYYSCVCIDYNFFNMFLYISLERYLLNVFDVGNEKRLELDIVIVIFVLLWLRNLILLEGRVNSSYVFWVVRLNFFVYRLIYY